MEAPEDQATLFSELISSPEASRSRAPISARRAEAWDSSEEAGVPYGWKCSGSSNLSVRLGSSLRTFLLSALAGLTPYSLAWRKRVTPRGRWWWALGRSEPRTGEIGSGSSGGEWPTPMKADGDNPEKLHNHRKDGSNLTLRGATDWPTLHGADNSENPRRNGPTGNELGRAVTAEWRIPRASEAGHAGRRSASHDGQTGLAEQVQADWPTMTARDWRSTKASPETHGKNARPLSEVAGLDWPTPKEVDGRPKGNAGGNRKSPGLDSLARAGQLDAENPNTNGSRPGSLNPDWVETLLGTPPGWTDLPEGLARKLYAERRSSKPGADETA